MADAASAEPVAAPPEAPATVAKPSDASGASDGAAPPRRSIWARLAATMTLYQLFMYTMGITVCIAFWPLYFDIEGLMGRNGIQPTRQMLAWHKEKQGAFWAFIQYPTIFWLCDAGWFMRGVTIVGFCLGVALTLGYASRVQLGLTYYLFLSIIVAGGDFTTYIWDFVLLEMLFLLLWAPIPTLIPRRVTREDKLTGLVLTALRHMNFRLWMGMGVCKFVYPRPQWMDGTYMVGFYTGQPMPAPLAWEMSQLPLWHHQFSAIMVFLTEIIMPPWTFLSRKWRVVLFWAYFGLQVLIHFSGNYAYFNIITVVSGIPLIIEHAEEESKEKGKEGTVAADGSASTPPAPPPAPLPAAPALTRAALRASARAAAKRVGAFALRLPLYANIWLGMMLIVFMFIPGYMGPLEPLNINWAFDSGFRSALPYAPLKWVTTATKYGTLYHLVHPHGVFREYVQPIKFLFQYEGSADGVTWKRIKFRVNPDTVYDPPPQYAPNFYRLDHQMFYESMGWPFYISYRQNNYYTAYNTPSRRLVQRLLQGSKPVISLLREFPFAPGEMRYARVWRVEYRFTNKTSCWEPPPKSSSFGGMHSPDGGVSNVNFHEMTVSDRPDAAWEIDEDVLDSAVEAAQEVAAQMGIGSGAEHGSTSKGKARGKDSGKGTVKVADLGKQVMGAIEGMLKQVGREEDEEDEEGAGSLWAPRPPPGFVDPFAEDGEGEDGGPPGPPHHRVPPRAEEEGEDGDAPPAAPPALKPNAELEDWLAEAGEEEQEAGAAADGTGARALAAAPVEAAAAATPTPTASPLPAGPRMRWWTMTARTLLYDSTDLGTAAMKGDGINGGLMHFARLGRMAMSMFLGDAEDGEEAMDEASAHGPIHVHTFMPFADIVYPDELHIWQSRPTLPPLLPEDTWA